MTACGPPLALSFICEKINIYLFIYKAFLYVVLLYHTSYRVQGAIHTDGTGLGLGTESLVESRGET